MCKNFMEKERNILDSMSPAQNPFRVPENYFADFHSNMEKQITGMNPEAKEISLFVKIRPWIYIAASFLAFIFCIQWYVSNMVKLSDFSAENNDSIEVLQTEETAFLYTYMDDLAIMDYLASNEEEWEGGDHGK